MFDFGEAIRLMKNGQAVARQGWNGKGMFIYLTKFESELKLEMCFVMRTAQGLNQPGWLASQADMLAEDWVIV